MSSKIINPQYGVSCCKRPGSEVDLCSVVALLAAQRAAFNDNITYKIYDLQYTVHPPALKPLDLAL
jgi:hypothetical protein